MRGYHNSCALLGDARIISAGGNDGPTASPDWRRTSVFYPPYLFRANGTLATRPTFTGTNGSGEPPIRIAYGQTITLCAANPDSVKRASLIKAPVTTHGFDQDQRFIDLPLSRANGRLYVTAPANGTVAPPGDYMLFLVANPSDGGTDVPSIARWIQIGSLAAPDHCDDIAPDAVVDLSGCTTADQNAGELLWTAMADDYSSGVSGRAASYDIRYKIATTAPSPSTWSTWTAAQGSIPMPGAAGASETAQITGLSPNTSYWFGIKVVDDNGNASSVSNLVRLQTLANHECADGFGGGSGGGGFRAQRASDPYQLQRAQQSGAALTTNSMLDGLTVGEVARDALRLTPAAGTAANNLSAFVWAAPGHAVAVEDARLLVVDHSAQTRAYVADGQVVAGTPAPLVSATSSDSGDVAASLGVSGGAGVSLLAGERLAIDMPEDGAGTNTLVLIARREGTPASGSSDGIVLRQDDGQGGWSSGIRLHPRRGRHSIAVRGLTSRRVQLEATTDTDLADAFALVPTLDVPVITTLAPIAATDTQEGDVRASLARADSSVAWFVGPDTLALSYALPALGEGLTRDIFLQVDGRLSNVAAATAARAQQPKEHEAPLPVAFALHANRPNPFTGSTVLGFDLPRAAEVRLEIFDAQGRRIQRFAGRYAAGRHDLEWNGMTSAGAHALPGIYLCRMTAGEFRAQSKLTITQ